MTIQRMDHVGVVVDDLAAAVALRRIMFAVDDTDGVVASMRAHGAELVGEVAQYEDTYRLCYLRGPDGIIVASAEELG
ncbi:hypothetical protein [Lapillicoccus sp.]|uniref:hypothetical protein n=1 Tax=Lapillicoccus sp. TaxID=1909287 RepID=UPI003266FD7E